LRLTDADRSPALIERRYGLGRVIQFCIPADAEWSNWPEDASYLILLQELNRYLAQTAASPGQVVVGEPLNECIGDQQVYTGENAGVWFSDDDAVLMSVKTYREFVVPYNSRILEAFGGGCIHYCGNATHHADNFLATKGLKALNIYNLYDIPSVKKLQDRLQDKVVLFVCDFTPVEYDAYFDEMLATLSHRGIVICSQFSPVVGLLRGGKYDAVRRDLRAERQAVCNYLRAKLTV
jgi:hypothetical protein